MGDRAAKILDGFRIDSLNMRDAETGELVWQSDTVWDKNSFATEIVRGTRGDARDSNKKKACREKEQCSPALEWRLASLARCRGNW